MDLRLGTEFLVTRADRLPAIVPGRAQGAEFQRRIHVPLGRFLVLPGHQTALASTLEYIKLPSDLCAMVLTKSSWARTFTTIETAPWVHPCYRGCLTLEVANVSETPLVLYPGVRIAQLVILEVRLDDPVSDSPSGTFLGTIRPEPHSFRKPRDELGLLGVDRRFIREPLEARDE